MRSMIGSQLPGGHRQLELLGVGVLLPAEVIEQSKLGLEAAVQSAGVGWFVVVQVAEDVADRGEVGHQTVVQRVPIPAVDDQAHVLVLLSVEAPWERALRYARQDQP
jgi:hypothetical protein